MRRGTNSIHSLSDKTYSEIKKRAMYYINIYRTIVGLEKSKAAAIILVDHMKQSYDRFNKDEEMEYEKNILMFDTLVECIKAY